MHLLTWPLVRSHGYTSSRCISGFFDPFNNRSPTLHPLTNILAAKPILAVGSLWHTGTLQKLYKFFSTIVFLSGLDSWLVFAELAHYRACLCLFDACILW